MPLVLCMLGIFVLISLLIFIFLLSTIRIQIQNLEMGNLSGKIRKKYTLVIELYFLDKIRYLRKKIKQDQLQNKKWKKKIEMLEKKELEELKKDKLFYKKWIDILKSLKIQLTKFSLRIDIGTEDAIFTSYIVAGIASIIGIILPHITKKEFLPKCHYIINPIYVDQNRYHIALDSIIRIKIVHIIYIIYILIQKGSKENERTSNRRSYDHSNELYSRNG